jgi:agmatinase
VTEKPRNSDLAFTRSSLYGTEDEPSFSGALSFMRRRYSRDIEGVDVAVLGVPFDLATTNRAGARLGPRAIRAASSIMAWDRAWGWDFDPFERLAVVDYGDCPLDPAVPQAIPAQIERCVAGILAQGAATLCLGGDHFLTYPALKAHAARHGPLALIHFDAHSDTWADEPGRIDHGTMFFHALQDGLIDPARSVQIGIRTNNPDTHGIRIIDAGEVRSLGAEGVSQIITHRTGGRKCYLTFDIDCLDPAFAPGTGTPVAGGLSSGEACDILRRLGAINLVGMDVVEVAPAYDVSEITALAAATIALDLLAIYAATRTKS